jgi:hypothetical protein
MEDKAGVDPKVLNDVELIALVRETWEEIDAHGAWNELNVLLHDFAAEASEAACALKSAVRRVDGVEPARVEKSSNRQTQDADTTVQVPKNSTTRIPHLRGAFHET